MGVIPGPLSASEKEAFPTGAAEPRGCQPGLPADACLQLGWERRAKQLSELGDRVLLPLSFSTRQPMSVLFSSSLTGFFLLPPRECRCRSELVSWSEESVVS